MFNTVEELIDSLEKQKINYLSIDTETYYRKDLSDKPFIMIEKNKNNAPYMATVSYRNKETGEILDFAFDEKTVNSQKFKTQLFNYFKQRNIKLFSTNCKFDMTMLANIGVDVLKNKWGEFLNIPYHTHPEDFERNSNNKSVAGSLSKQGRKYLKNYKNHDNTISSLQGSMAKELGVKKEKITYKQIYDRYPEKMVAYAKYDTHSQEELINYHYQEIIKLSQTPAFSKEHQGMSEWDVRSQSYQINDDIIKNVWEIERNGMYVNQKKLRRKTEEIQGAYEEIKSVIEASLTSYLPKDYKGKTININSSIQLAQAFRNKYGIKWRHYTKKGQLQYNKDVVKSLIIEAKQEKNEPLLKDLKNIETANKMSKYLSTYLIGLKDFINDKSYVNPTFRLIGTITGRFSSSNPNFQNIPKGDIEFEVGEKTYKLNIRDIFGIENKDNLIVKLDYDQQEYRYAGQLSQSKSLMKFIRAGKDIHTATASLLFNTAYEDVKKELRSKGKTQNFGIVYGLSTLPQCQALGYELDFKLVEEGYETLKKYHKNHTEYPEVYNLPPHKSKEEWIDVLGKNEMSILTDMMTKMVNDTNDIKAKQKLVKSVRYYLSSDVQKALKETKDLRDKYKEQFPEIDDFDRKLQEKVKESGYVYTENGNPRKLSKDDTYKALNTKIQGSCAEMQKIKIKEIFNYIKKNNLETKIRNLIHDEMLLEVPKNEIEHIPKIKKIFETFKQYDFNFTTGLEVGKTWHNCIEIENQDLGNIQKIVEQKYSKGIKVKRKAKAR